MIKSTRLAMDVVLLPKKSAPVGNVPTKTLRLNYFAPSHQVGCLKTGFPCYLPEGPLEGQTLPFRGILPGLAEPAV